MCVATSRARILCRGRAVAHNSQLGFLPPRALCDGLRSLEDVLLMLREGLGECLLIVGELVASTRPQTGVRSLGYLLDRSELVHVVVDQLQDTAQISGLDSSNPSD